MKKYIQFGGATLVVVRKGKDGVECKIVGSLTRKAKEKHSAHISGRKIMLDAATFATRKIRSEA